MKYKKKYSSIRIFRHKSLQIQLFIIKYKSNTAIPEYSGISVCKSKTCNIRIFRYNSLCKSIYSYSNKKVIQQYQNIQAQQCLQIQNLPLGMFFLPMHFKCTHLRQQSQTTESILFKSCIQSSHTHIADNLKASYTVHAPQLSNHLYQNICVSYRLKHFHPNVLLVLKKGFVSQYFQREVLHPQHGQHLYH